MAARCFTVAAFLSILIAGSCVWRQADRAAIARAEILAQPFSEDNSVTVAFSPSGFLNRDVRIAAFDFGAEDRTIEDEYADQILHDTLGKTLYAEGFRNILVPGSDILRPILVDPQSAATEKR